MFIFLLIKYIHCKNGKIDLKSNKFIPRITEYNGQMLNFKYIDPQDLTNDMKENVANYVKRVLPDKETRRMVLEFLWIHLIMRYR